MPTDIHVLGAAIAVVDILVSRSFGLYVLAVYMQFYRVVLTAATYKDMKLSITYPGMSAA